MPIHSHLQSVTPQVLTLTITFAQLRKGLPSSVALQAPRSGSEGEKVCSFLFK